MAYVLFSARSLCAKIKWNKLTWLMAFLTIYEIRAQPHRRDGELHQIQLNTGFDIANIDRVLGMFACRRECRSPFAISKWLLFEKSHIYLMNKCISHVIWVDKLCKLKPFCAPHVGTNIMLSHSCSVHNSWLQLHLITCTLHANYSVLQQWVGYMHSNACGIPTESAIIKFSFREWRKTVILGSARNASVTTIFFY